MKNKSEDLSLPYEVVIIDKGNGNWYHGPDDPLQHKWYITGDRATCLICRQVIEKRMLKNLS